MMLGRPTCIDQMKRELDTRGYAILKNVQLPRRYFEPSEGADLLFKPMEGEKTGYVLLIQADVKYIGSDALLRSAFSSQVVRGWRPLHILAATDPESVLRQAEVLLGLHDREPQATSPSTHGEIVIEPDGLTTHPNTSRGTRADLQRFGTDLVVEARHGRLGPALFREKETLAVMRILSKEGKNALCLLGECGVGKTKVVENLAVQIAAGNVPDALRGCRILDINLSILAAGASFQNQFEGLLVKALEQARCDKHVILFFDELHTLCTLPGNASQLVKSDLGRGRVRCIGATTNAEYRRKIEPDTALARRFQVLPVLELTRAQTVRILSDYRVRLYQHHHVVIPDQLLEMAVDLADRYVRNRYLPDKALDLLDEACACARIASLRKLLPGRSRSPQQEARHV
jgi:ATP-dependent Clp protease ATP-binding subunit ClpA